MLLPLRRTTALVFLALAGLFFLRGINRKTSLRSPNPSGSAQSTLPATLRNDTTHQVEVEIVGYWKEVRASLGLAPLSGAVVVTSPAQSLGRSSHEAAGAYDYDLDGWDEQRQRHLGRLNPALQRRRLLFSTSHGRETEHAGSSSGFGSGSSSFDGSHDFTVADIPSTDANVPAQNSAHSKLYPDLFLAPDAQDGSHMSVRAIAASFRAIAARELRARTRGLPGHRVRYHTHGAQN